MINQYSIMKNQMIEEHLYSGIEIDLSNCFLEEEDIEKIKEQSEEIQLVFEEMVSLANNEECSKEINLLEKELLNILENDNLLSIDQKLVSIRNKLTNIRNQLDGLR